MSNYTKEDTCVGCGAHISEYHNIPCVYDPDFQPVQESESELKEWVEDRQLNGDDGSGFNDYEEESEL